MHKTTIAVIFLAALLWPLTALAGSSLSTVERQKIEALIGAVEGLDNAQFIRNGKAYGASAAARFLRGKWKERQEAVRSAEDFIDKVAAFSSTTGKPYLIRFSDGREMPTADFFRSFLVAWEREGEQ